MTGRSGYPLRQVLPAEVLVGGNAVWSRYRQYPVFSARWLGGRSLLFCSVIALVTVFTGGGVGLAVQDGVVALKVGLSQFAAFSLMAMLGPALATIVRHRRWTESRERKAVVLAVLVGIVLSYAIDKMASAYVMSLVQPQLEILGMAPSKAPEVGPVLKAIGLALNIAALILIYGLFGGGLALRAYFSERRRWEAHRHALELGEMSGRAHEADLRLGVLQAQVEPHFLFNTLASVRALVRQDPAQAETTLDALVAFLRATIPKLRDDRGLHSTLGQQLDICASYLALMQVRMGGRLSYAVTADEAQRALSFPPSLLITLVENAIKHGIEPRPGPGRIEVSVVREGERLRIRVVDDGAGLQPGIGGGMGLANVREQLVQRFGAQASFRLHPGETGGVVAEIEIPCTVATELQA
ncbi:histidine kinase [Pseudoxanthomonas daejeonensis]|uniref:sensor histidine kinase n=1 Tax=Pseudoxanthomonas daejeonensis TaxID=266062 RepID=UPI001F544097|nr:histidine kinase [Pseudoxanthomonas daejeonensis]UNK57941.1 histidine kinase [Pseudoxanthomonas daejeonensis]